MVLAVGRGSSLGEGSFCCFIRFLKVTIRIINYTGGGGWGGVGRGGGYAIVLVFPVVLQ